eukprot:scaffold1553_cov132-Isochrysis_galbana.AAC.4
MLRHRQKDLHPVWQARGREWRCRVPSTTSAGYRCAEPPLLLAHAWRAVDYQPFTPLYALLAKY